MDCADPSRRFGCLTIHNRTSDTKEPSTLCRRHVPNRRLDPPRMSRYSDSTPVSGH